MPDRFYPVDPAFRDKQFVRRYLCTKLNASFYIYRKGLQIPVIHPHYLCLFANMTQLLFVMDL